jgi:hypothetical protein
MWVTRRSTIFLVWPHWIFNGKFILNEKDAIFKNTCVANVYLFQENLKIVGTDLVYQ